MTAKRAVYTEPTSTQSLRALQKRDYESTRAKHVVDGTHVEEDDGNARNFGVEDNDTDAYVGVSPEYAGYGDPTQKPYAATGDSPEALAEAKFKESQKPYDYEAWEERNAPTAVEASDEDDTEDTDDLSGLQ